MTREIKILVLGLIGIGLMGASAPSAYAMVGLKQVQIANGSQVNLLFDGKVNKGQIKTEFFNDIIQISLNDVQVYPAKISPVNSSILTKVFAYQYAPKLVRCRLSIKGKAELIKDLVEVNSNGKMISVKIDPTANEKLAEKAPTSIVDKVTSSAAQVIVPQGPQNAPTEEEKRLLDKVMKASDSAPSAPVKVSVVSPGKESEKISEKNPEKAAEKKMLTSAKPLPSPFRIFGKFIFIMGAFGLIALVVRKFVKADSPLGKLSGKGKKGKMIEVVSNHYLGPKKSISVVRVAGRVLVLGVTNESINLITQIGGENGNESALNMDIAELEDIGLRINQAQESRDAKNAAAQALRAAGAVPKKSTGFADLLAMESGKPAANQPINNSALRAPSLGPTFGGAPAPILATQGGAMGGPIGGIDRGVRAQIRNKMEGLKPL